MKKTSKPVKASRKLTKRVKQEQAVNHEVVQPPVAQMPDDALPAQSVVASLPEQALQEEAVQPAVSTMVDAALDAAAQSVASAPLDLSLSLWAQAGAAAVAVDAGAGAGAAAGAGASTAAGAAATTAVETGAALSTAAIVAGVAAVGLAAAAGGGGGGAAAVTTVADADTTAPVIAFTAATDDVGSVTGALVSGARTDDTALVLTGTTEAGATVKVYNGATLLGNATVTGTNWSYSAVVADGTTYQFNAKATDAAGNTSAATTNFTVIGDTTAPVIDTTTGLAAHSATKTIDLTYTEALDATNIPLAASFAVTTGGVANPVASVSVTGSVMTLTLTNAFAAGAVTVSYTDPTAANDANAIQDAAGNDAIGFASGVIADGYLRGATVYIDTNGDGVADPAVDYLVGTTDASGNFFIQSGAPVGTIIAVGGINIDTGVKNTSPLKAPAGSMTINPLTTLVQAVVDASGGATTAAAAAATVATSLGLTAGLGGQSLLNYDPISAGNVGAQKAAAQVATIVALAEGASAGAGATVVANLATVVNNAGATTVGLADASTISNILPAAVQANTAVQSAISDASTAIGNAVSIGAISTAQSQALDTIAPDAPTTLSVATTTNDTTPAVRVSFNKTGTDGRAAVAGDTITLRENGAQAGTAVTLTAADIALGYKDVDASTLSEGSHTLSAVLTDQAGNVSAVATGVVVNIDTQAPAAPVINAVATDDVINSSEQTEVISGLAEANATVSLSIGGNTRTATANSSGNWSYTLQAADITAMGQGAETLSATATDTAGNVSAAGTREISVDTVAPTATAAVTSGAAIISDNTPALAGTITGTLGAGEVVAVYDGTTRLGLATVSGSAWTFNTPSRSNALHTFTAKVEDAAGNSGSAGTAYAVTVNATVPTATATITGAADDVTSITGNIASGGISNDSIPVLSGAVVGTLGTDSVVVYDGATRLGVATVTGTSWSYTPSAALSVGAHSFTAVIENSAGNQGAASTAYGLTLDFIAPNAAVINPVAIDNVVTASEKAAGIVVTGTAEAGSTVAVTWGAASHTATASGGGVWTVTFLNSEVPADNAASTISATVTDTAGNSGSAATRNVLIDTAGPTVTIATVSGNDAINTAEATAGVAITGTAEANAKLALTLGSGNVRSLAANGSGAWTYTLTAADIKAMGQGSETLTVTATDAAGNSGTAATKDITIDTLAPQLTAFSLASASDSGTKGDGRSNVGAPTLSFTAELGATLAIDAGSGSYVAAGITGTGGVQTLTKPSPFATDGTYVINLKATDAAGNITVRTASYLYDSSAPSAPAISAIADNVGTITGNLANNARSDDTQLVITGTAEAYSTVTVYNGSTTLGTAAANASGNWSYTTATLTNATAYVFSAKATDVAGNQGAASTTTTVTIDTSPPAAPAVALATDSGSSASDGITNVGTVNVIGLESDASWQYSTNGGTSFSNGTGTSFTLAAGTYAANAVLVKQTDVAGNAGVVGGNAAAITVDTTAPAAPALALATDSGTSASDGVTNVGTVNVTGLESGASWQYSTDGGTSFSSGTGTTFTLSAATYATGEIKVRQIDVAGNTGAVISNTAALVVDQTAPTATAAVTGADDNVTPFTGNLNSGDTTNDATLALSGTISAALATGDVVGIYDGSTRLAAATVSGTTWTYTTASLSNATHSFTAKVEDAAGNAGSAGTAYSVNVQASVPTATATITGADDNVALLTGAVASGGTSNDSTPTLSGAVVGTMASGEVVAIYDGATKLGNATVSAATWSYTPSALSGGAHSFMAVVESALGNQGTTSSAYSLTLDLVAPAAPVISAVATDNIVNVYEQTAAISGTAEANATVNLSLGGNTRTATANSSGAWSYTLTGADVTAMGQGAETLSATAMDAAGNTSSAVTRAISVDTVAPTLSTVTVNGTQLTLTFSEAIDPDHYPSTFPTVLVNGTAVAVVDATINGSVATLVLATAATSSSVVTLSYTDPTSGDDVNALQDLAGNDVASGANIAVTNQTTVVVLPTLSDSVLDNVTNLEVNSNIVLNFSATVTAASGKYIHIVNDSNSTTGLGFRSANTVKTLDILVTDTTQVTISGSKVTLNPTADLDLANNYHITIDAGAFTSASGGALAAYDGTTTLNFSTVTPGTTSLANAVASQVMNTDGTLGSGHFWLDIEGIGSPSAAAGTEPILDLSSGNYALVAKDYDATGASNSLGYDGVKVADFYVAANNFGAGDLLYIDNQGAGAANDLTLSNIINNGNPPTTLQFAGTTLGGLVDITLAGSTATFDTVLQMKTLLSASTSPVISA